MNSLVSVIITTYRRNLKYLSQAVDSVINQSYENIEIIVVDDNGRETEFQITNAEFLKKYNDITYLINETNSGAQFSRNRGILASHGQYLAFLDDDDFWAHNKIERQTEYFIKYPEAGLIFCDGYIFEDGDLENLTKYQVHPVFDFPIRSDMMLYLDYVGTTSQVLIKRECFAKVGLFDPEMPARQDYEMWIRISKEYPLVGCPDIMFYHRIHKGDQISANSKKRLIGYRKIYLKYKNEYKKHHRAKTKFMMVLCSKSIEEREYVRAGLYFIRGCVSHPAEAVKLIIGKVKELR